MRYVSKAHSKYAPWGQKSRPIRFDCWHESPLSLQHSCDASTTFGGQTFERGIWYYSGIEMIDHHDISGFENPWAAVETMAGRETRPQLFINTLNRLRMLDFTEESKEPGDTMLVNSICTPCQQKHAYQKGFDVSGGAAGQMNGSNPSTYAPDTNSDISFSCSDQ